MTQPGQESLGAAPGAAPSPDSGGTVAMPPVTVPPPVAPPPVEPPRRGRAATVIFAVLALLFLLGAGGMTALYLQESKDSDKLTTQVKDRDTTIAKDADKIKELTKRLDEAKQAKTDAEKKLTTYQDCVTAIRAVAAAEVNGTPDPVKEQKMTEACASIFLGVS